jgi:hypothetical protein
MEVMPEKSFLLDENTTQESDYMQLLEINDTLRFTMYNKAKHNILIYDIQSEHAVNSIQLYKEGPNATGNNIQGYYIQSPDSIYLYDYWGYILLLVNHRGEITNRINLSEKLLSRDENCLIPPYPYPRTIIPIRMVNDQIILQGMNGNTGDCKQPVCTVTALYNLSDGTIRYANAYPEIYGDPKKISDSWGVFSYRAVPYDLNNRDEMVLSFPADDHIAVSHLNSDKTEYYFAGYSGEDKIKPVTDRSTKADILHYLEQTLYIGIFFDKYRNLYYRIVAKPLYDYDINDRKTQMKELSVIILDKNFNKVGEYDIKEKARMWYVNSFVLPEGLHINIASEDDDYLKFIVLKPVKL